MGLLAAIKARASLVLAGLVLLALGGLYVSLLLARAKVAHLETSLATLHAAAKVQEQAIKDLNNTRAADNLALQQLSADYAALAQSTNGARQRLQQLERSNEQVRDYLSQPVPAELGCLLDGTCDKDTAR